MRGVLGVAIALAALVAACSPNDPPGGEGRLSIATGGAGGVYQVYGGGLADLLSDELPDSPTTAETTSASVDNLLLVADGGVYVDAIGYLDGYLHFHRLSVVVDDLFFDGDERRELGHEAELKAEVGDLFVDGDCFG